MLRKVYGKKMQYTYSEDDLFPSAAHYYLCYDEKTGEIFRRPNGYECPDGFIYIGNTPAKFAGMRRILAPMENRVVFQMKCKNCKHFREHGSDSHYGSCFKIEYEAADDVIAVVGELCDCREPREPIVGYMFGCIHFEKKDIQ